MCEYIRRWIGASIGDFLPVHIVEFKAFVSPDYASLASIQGPLKQAHQALKDMEQNKAALMLLICPKHN